MPCGTIGKTSLWTTRDPDTTHATTLKNLAECHHKLGHTDKMGTHASIPFQFPAMTIDGEAKLYAEGGQISTSTVYALPSLGHSMTTDLCMGWAFGQFHALDGLLPRLWHKATTYLPCHVEYLARVQFVNVAELLWHSTWMFTSTARVTCTTHSKIYL